MSARANAEREVRFTLPAEAVDAAQEGDEALSREAREAFVLARYNQGKLGPRAAAKALGLGLWDFYDLVRARGLSTMNYDDEDFERELARSRGRNAQGE